ncbi:MAG: formyltransferase family protein [Planctomycetaceae bacterium]
MHDKKYLLCLSTSKGYEVLRTATEFLDGSHCVVCIAPEKNVAVTFDESIRGVADEFKIPVVGIKEYLADLQGLVTTHGVTDIVCIGWRFLIPQDVIDLLPGKLVIAHDALLPRLRGFAPLPTAILTGEKQVGVTYLHPGEGVDDGEILWQAAVDVEPADTIAQLIRKVEPLYAQGAKELFAGRLQKGRPQDHAAATYSIWRDEDDYLIDWNRSAIEIERCVRALGTPYLGAQTFMGLSRIVIRQATVVDDLTFAIRQPGKFWKIDGEGRPHVVCGEGILRIDLAVNELGQAVTFDRLRVRLRSQPTANGS